MLIIAVALVCSVLSTPSSVTVPAVELQNSRTKRSAESVARVCDATAWSAGDSFTQGSLSPLLLPYEPSGPVRKTSLRSNI